MTQPPARQPAQQPPAEDPDAASRKTTNGKLEGNRKAEPRSLSDHPIDPNAATSKIRVPPGVDAEDAMDPGRQTPDAPKVDNRSGD